MSTPVTHLNLLRRAGPVHVMGWSLLAVAMLTVLGMLAYGRQLRLDAESAVRERDAVAQRLALVKAHMAEQLGARPQDAASQALRTEVAALQPSADSARALLEVLRSVDGGSTGAFAQTLSAITRAIEPGLWLTSLSVSQSGKRVDLTGGARDGEAVLHFARRANEALEPQALHLDVLDMQPLSSEAAPSASVGQGVGARAVSFHLS